MNGKHEVLRLLMVCLLALLANVGCLGNSAPSWKPWRESCAVLPEARAGKAFALHRSFHAAFAQVMRPFPNQGEGAREIGNNLDSILRAIGDRAFAEALLRERPVIRSAVRDSMVEGDIRKHYPLTFQLFEEAPQNEWPSDFAEERYTGTGPSR